MNNVETVNICGVCFLMDESAAGKLKQYLYDYEKSLSRPDEAKEIMEDVEARVAEIFHDGLHYSNQVVDEKMVNDLIAKLGRVDAPRTEMPNESRQSEKKVRHRYYRDKSDLVLGGVCSGLAAYLGQDNISLVRLAMALLAIFTGGTIVILYLVIWLVVPAAETVAQKLELRGLPMTPENVRKYSQN